MAGTITTSTFFEDGVRGIYWSWECNSGGIVSGNQITGVYGKYLCHKITPDQSSGYVPDSGYDVKIYDSNSQDLMAGTGANQTDALPSNQWVMPWFPNSYMIYLTNETLELRIDNAGNDRLGEIEVIFANKWTSV